MSVRASVRLRWRHLFKAGLEGKEWRAIDIFKKDRDAALRRLVKAVIAYDRSQRQGKAKPA
jgi:hypothetical protein